MNNKIRDLAENLSLTEYYNSLPKTEFVAFREKVKAKCGIKSNNTFYTWIRDNSKVNIPARIIINKIAKQKLQYD